MSAPKYPKIETLFERDKETFKVDETKIRRDEFLIPSEWVVTEKIDGMNIRVSLEFVDCQDCFQEDCEKHENIMGDWVVKYYGRNENSQFPPLMLEHLQKTFPFDKISNLWKCKKDCDTCTGNGWVGWSVDSSLAMCSNLDPYQIVLYGEGYGAGIQTGGGYNKDKIFRLFDVLVGETWLSRENVEDVAKQLDIFCAPLLGRAWELDLIIAGVRGELASKVAEEEGVLNTKAEGIVAQTKIPLFNSRGDRLMFKLKTSDFA